MKKKYYYDCPIQALYMNKEFGVEFFIKDDDGDDYDFTEWYLNSQNVLELFIELKAFTCRIYVKSESEHIFEPKKGDEGRWARLVGAHYANYNGEQWVSAGIEEKLPNIIYRNGKHFFNPKEEN